jgi:uncharacterized protein
LLYPGDVVTDLVQIRELGASQETENQDFRRYLSAHHFHIETFQQLATEVQQQIDCTACANCCRHSIVAVDKSEIATIARHLNYEADHVTRQYTTVDPEAPARRLLESTTAGCVFLDGNLCTIYEVRPKACRDFPHVALGEHSLGARFASLCRWASLCPIIYNSLERYKHIVGYRRRPAIN